MVTAGVSLRRFLCNADAAVTIVCMIDFLWYRVSMYGFGCPVTPSALKGPVLPVCNQVAAELIVFHVCMMCFTASCARQQQELQE